MSTNPLHFPFSIRQLAAALGGELRLAQLPPIDGSATVATRIVFAPEAIQPGTIFWDLPAPFSTARYRPEEIFLRGAFGMISPHPIEPWAGGFALLVLDSLRAMAIAQQLARQQLLVSAGCRPAPLASR